MPGIQAIVSLRSVNMKKTIPGVLLCLSALMLVHMNYAILGIPAFIVGIIVMNKGGGQKG